MSDWLLRKYGETDSDPWGLSRRSSQKFRYLRTLESITPYFSSGKVIDIGCATGEFSALLLKQFPSAEVVGVDLISDAVTRARVKYNTITFVHGSIFDLPSLVNPVAPDMIVLLEVMYYLTPQEQLSALKLVYDCLSDKGVIVVSSVCSRAPYLNSDKLTHMLETHFDIQHIEKLHIKPLNELEKLTIKVERYLQRSFQSKSINMRYVLALISVPIFSVCHRLLPIFGDSTVSHTIIVATKKQAHELVSGHHEA